VVSWAPVLQLAVVKFSTYAPCRDLHQSLRTSDCGLWDGCPSLSSPPPPIRARGYYFVSLFRLFSSCYSGAGHGPRRLVLLAI